MKSIKDKKSPVIPTIATGFFFISAYLYVIAFGRNVPLWVLRDYCNENSIPAARQNEWNTSTWHSLLLPHILLKYCGYGIWNVHNKNGSLKPQTEWIIERKAHEAIITEDVAHEIVLHRKVAKQQHTFDKGYSRSRNSPYLLSGGLFTCGRCGSNMNGLKNKGYKYYLCGSQPQRKNRGCGPAVFVPLEFIETHVVDGLRDYLNTLIEQPRFVKELNRKLRGVWEYKTGSDSDADRKIIRIDEKIARIRTAIEDGLEDNNWAIGRIRSLKDERARLELMKSYSGEPPYIEAEDAEVALDRLSRGLGSVAVSDKKKLLRNLVHKIELAPEKLMVSCTYSIPGQYMHSTLAGAVYAGFHQNFPGLFYQVFKMKKQGRKWVPDNL